MKILHCSDIHLDSPMERNLPPEQARERNAELCATFARMVGYAVREGFRAVLIAGDLFDSRRASARTARFVLDQIRSAPEVDFLYLRGNHDEGRSPFDGMELPENFKTFGKDWTSHRYGDVVITGAEPEDWAGIYETLSLDPVDTNLLMLHGQISTQPGAEQVCLPLLREKHIHYLALGHLHSFQSGALGEAGSWCYCGCLEGRGFDECGQKGFVALEAAAGKVDFKRIPFAGRTLEAIGVDISGLRTVSQLQQALETAAKDIPPSSLVKFTLTGEYAPDTQKDLRLLEKMLAPRFYFVKIKDESRLMLHRESYEHDISLKGEFIRLVMASDRPEAEKEQIILAGLQALSGEEVRL